MIPGPLKLCATVLRRLTCSHHYQEVGRVRRRAHRPWSGVMQPMATYEDRRLVCLGCGHRTVVTRIVPDREVMGPPPSRGSSARRRTTNEAIRRSLAAIIAECDQDTSEATNGH